MHARRGLTTLEQEAVVTVRVLMVETETVLHLYIIFVVGTSSGGLPSPPESAEDVVSTNECAWNQSLMC